MLETCWGKVRSQMNLRSNFIESYWRASVELPGSDFMTVMAYNVEISQHSLTAYLLGTKLR